MTLLYMRLALVLVSMLVARTAYAGLDCNEAVEVKSLERFAKDKKAQLGEYDWLCLSFASAKLKARIESASRSAPP